MPEVSAVPDLTAIITPILGEPYAQWDCFRLVRHLIYEGFGMDLDEDPQQAVKAIVEVWYRGDARDPLTLLQPWDCWILATKGLYSDHVGIVVDTQHFVHTRRRTGVCVEPLLRWKSKLLQLARLRMLS